MSIAPVLTSSTPKLREVFAAGFTTGGVKRNTHALYYGRLQFSYFQF